MKKTAAILMGLCLCLGMPAAAGAAQVSVISLSQSSTIDTTVPDSHMIYIQTEHARVLFRDEEGEDEDEEQATMYAVERFSQPEFLIYAEKGWKIHAILLNGVDVTEQWKDGMLTLPEVYEDQKLVVETEESKEESGEDHKKPGGEDKKPEGENKEPESDKTPVAGEKDPVKKAENPGTNTGTQNGNASGTTAAKTADQQMHLTYSITAVIAAILIAILARNKIRKNNKMDV